MYTGRIWIVLLCGFCYCLLVCFLSLLIAWHHRHMHTFFSKQNKTKHLKTKNKLPTVLETGNSSHWSKNYQSVLGTCSDTSPSCHKFVHDVTANKCPGLLPTKLPSAKYHLCNIQILSLVFNFSLLEFPAWLQESGEHRACRSPAIQREYLCCYLRCAQFWQESLLRETKVELFIMTW